MEELEYGINQLHKKQKTNRIQEGEAKRENLKANLLLAFTCIGFLAFIVIGGLMTRY